ncbi:MAG: NAD-dependent epimerase/dehydratase family protein [Polaromonas sp.]|nr:NAD-dependent epimerase/dehydratase family protein [Polaromonas sp.]
MKFTVLGGHGFIGGHLVKHLKAQGHVVDDPGRELEGVMDGELGHVIYAIGLTADFRKRPFDTVDAHVSLLARLLQRCRFESWLYLSSTRVYAGLGKSQVTEDDAILVPPGPDSLYNLSKLMGESLCLTLPNPAIRVARLSNVYGKGMSPDNFLGSVLSDLRRQGRVTVNEAPESGKDYVGIEDVCTLLQAISAGGKERLYNVASGRSLSHKLLLERICALTGFSADYAVGAPIRTFPLVDVSRARHEFDYRPRHLFDTVGGLLTECGIPRQAGDDL